jgi:hypothetical protein
MIKWLPSMPLLWLLLLVVYVVPAPAQQALPAQPFPAHVGDIAFDAVLDDPAFTVCDSIWVLQYYNAPSYYKAHKQEIARFLTSGYKRPADTVQQTGYLTVRFMINCKGATGRFRLFEMDNDYQPFHFSEKVSLQLLQLVKQLTGWKPPVYKEKYYDTYQYITFRLNNGSIINITP